MQGNFGNVHGATSYRPYIGKVCHTLFFLYSLISGALVNVFYSMIFELQYIFSLHVDATKKKLFKIRIQLNLNRFSHWALSELIFLLDCFILAQLIQGQKSFDRGNYSVMSTVFSSNRMENIEKCIVINLWVPNSFCCQKIWLCNVLLYVTGFLLVKKYIRGALK